MFPFIFMCIPHFSDFSFSQMNDSAPNKPYSVDYFFKADDNRLKRELFSILLHSLH